MVSLPYRSRTRIISQLLRRLGLGFLTAFAALTLTFFILRLIGDDPVDSLLAQGLTSAEQAESVRQKLGLNQPILIQYVEYLSGLIRGDFGTSLYTQRPVLFWHIPLHPTTSTTNNTRAVSLDHRTCTIRPCNRDNLGPRYGCNGSLVGAQTHWVCSSNASKSTYCSPRGIHRHPRFMDDTQTCNSWFKDLVASNSVGLINQRGNSSINLFEPPGKYARPVYSRRTSSRD
jgi:hypothetical protein